MNFINQLFKSLNFGLALLLALLFTFENKIDVSGWQIIFGRFHPLLLHLPIGFFVLAVIFYWFRKSIEATEFTKIFTLMLNLTVATGFLSAISGLLLASEGFDSTSEVLFWHKIWAIIFSYSTYIFSIWFNNLRVNPQRISLLWILLLLILTAHKGAVMTHGDNFLNLFSITSKNQLVIHPDSSIYKNVIFPILDQKCITCHNYTKANGNLNMTDSASMAVGGKNGAAIVSGQAEKSLMYQRMLLPDYHEEHMPPIGKIQLSINDVKILESWINAGASYSLKIDDIELDSAYHKLIKSVYLANKGIAKIYNFKTAPQKVIENLQSPFRKVYPLYQNSPALAVSYLLSSGFTMTTFKDLEKIKTQIVELNLNNMPFEDSGMEVINSMQNLEILLLNQTKITSKGVKLLSKNKNLKHLSFTNTDVTEEIFDIIPLLPNLKKIFLSNTKLSQKSIDKLRTQFPHIEVIFEDYSNIITHLTPPILENTQNILENDEKLRLKHYINGAIIKYTLNNEEPDSINSITYTEPIVVNNFVNVKAKAFKEGWISSDTKNFTIYTKGVKPTETTLLTKPNDRYKGQGSNGLINNKLGPINNLPNLNWLGFKDEPFEALFSFDKPISLSTIIFSYGLSISQYVFPPTHVTIFGGNNDKQMEKIAQINLPPFQPENKEQLKNDKILLTLNGASYQYYKIFAQNLNVIPPWHPGKGGKAWVFIDEIFFYK